jgi:plastocyanin
VIALMLAAALIPSAAPKHKTIHLGDNFFAPKTVTVARNARVTWKWPGFDQAGDVHDVKLKSGPKKAKKFHSEQAASDYTFKRKLTVKGTSKIVCTLHEQMKMTIKVR